MPHDLNDTSVNACLITKIGRSGLWLPPILVCLELLG